MGKYEAECKESLSGLWNRKHSQALNLARRERNSVMRLARDEIQEAIWLVDLEEMNTNQLVQQGVKYAYDN